MLMHLKTHFQYYFVFLLLAPALTLLTALLYCGWSGSSKTNIILECMKSEDQKQMDIYLFNVTSDSKAELIHKDEVIAKFYKLTKE